jgi:hypothetical protein
MVVLAFWRGNDGHELQGLEYTRDRWEKELMPMYQ